MRGAPELVAEKISSKQIVTKQYTEDEARLRISDFLKRQGARKYKNIPEIEIFEFGLIYKPHYVCRCRGAHKQFFRIIDAETGERNFRLDLVFSRLTFNEEVR
jgi:hypothetical protein